jgi:uncharacterized small protein (TIGR04563 family)
MLKEISAEAVRLDRSMSWIIQRAWKSARGKIMNVPTIDAPASAHTSKADGESSSSTDP